MPGLIASLAGSIAGWVVSDYLDPYADTVTRTLAGFVTATVVFFLVRNWLKRLRDG
jgi:hypothetical protein